MTKQKYINLLELDISKYINNCHRKDRTYIIRALIKKPASQDFWKNLATNTIYVVIKNLVGVLAARLAGVRVVDLMELWHCDRDYLVFSPLDLMALRKAECSSRGPGLLRRF